MKRSKNNRILTAILHCMFLIFLSACEKELVMVNSSYFTPLESGDWEVSSPNEQGLDTVMIQEMIVRKSGRKRNRLQTWLESTFHSCHSIYFSPLGEINSSRFIRGYIFTQQYSKHVNHQRHGYPENICVEAKGKIPIQHCQYGGGQSTS